jgi:hypothetical protein
MERRDALVVAHVGVCALSQEQLDHVWPLVDRTARAVQRSQACASQDAVVLRGERAAIQLAMSLRCSRDGPASRGYKYSRQAMGV